MKNSLKNLSRTIVGATAMAAVMAPAVAYDGIVSGVITQMRVRVLSATETSVNVKHATMANPGSCGGPTWYKLVLDGTERPQAIYKTILLAAATGQEIKFEVEGCSGGGFDGNPLIDGSWITMN